MPPRIPNKRVGRHTADLPGSDRGSHNLNLPNACTSKFFAGPWIHSKSGESGIVWANRETAIFFFRNPEKKAPDHPRPCKKIAPHQESNTQLLALKYFIFSTGTGNFRFPTDFFPNFLRPQILDSPKPKKTCRAPHTLPPSRNLFLWYPLRGCTPAGSCPAPLPPAGNFSKKCPPDIRKKGDRTAHKPAVFKKVCPEQERGARRPFPPDCLFALFVHREIHRFSCA